MDFADLATQTVTPLTNLLRVRPSVLRRFAEKIVVNKETGCWEWTGFKQHGYGRMTVVSIRKGPLLAHVFAYRMAVGDVPEGWHVHHKCENPSCVNPAHLEAVTPRRHLEINPKVQAKWNATHCPSGHEYTPENTIRSASGWRKCRQCCRIRGIEKHRKFREENPVVPQTHCKHGHELSGDNVYLDKRGARHCRTCSAARDEVRRKQNRDEINARRRQARREKAGGELWVPGGATCSKGHEYTPENTAYRKDGSRRCLICSRDQDKAAYRKFREANPITPKTHCKRGHEITNDSMYEYNGVKFCKACAALRQKEYLHRKKQHP